MTREDPTLRHYTIDGEVVDHLDIGRNNSRDVPPRVFFGRDGLIPAELIEVGDWLCYIGDLIQVTRIERRDPHWLFMWVSGPGAGDPEHVEHPTAPMMLRMLPDDPRWEHEMDRR